MKKVEKILFPIDFAENFETLLPWVSTFAEKFGATVYVLFVAQDLADFTAFHVPHGNIKAFQDEVLQAAQQKMSAVAQEYFKAIPKVETLVMSGLPADKIVEVANQKGVDLIVMGTHGRKGLEHAIFGSICEKVIRKASCPVLAINPAKA
ncbi:MAG: universal stress protein [Deltaproteobacteria bacterium]|nr:universal stress protein [Deltaproteobacteria bacterium]